MWKQILSWCTPRGVWLIGALAFVMGAGVATPLVAQAATVDVWNLGAATEDIRVGPSDEVWTMTGDKPTRLAPATNGVTTYTHPLAGTNVVAVDGSGMAWSSDRYDTGSGYQYVISRLDPATLEVRSWPVDTGLYATSIAADMAGDVWFARNSSALWRLHPATDTVVKWTLPISGVNIWSFDSTGRAWLSYSGGVAVLDPAASNLTYWAEPAGTWLAPIPDASDNVWFAVTYSGVDAIARLNPSTNQVTEWPCRAGCDGLVNVRPDGTGKVWFTEDGGGASSTGTSYIGRLDPAASPAAFSEWPLACGDVAGLSCTYKTEPRGLRFDSAGNVWVYFDLSTYTVRDRVARLTP
jgi:streptogramin lyase